MPVSGAVLDVGVSTLGGDNPSVQAGWTAHTRCGRPRARWLVSGSE